MEVGLHAAEPHASPPSRPRPCGLAVSCALLNALLSPPVTPYSRVFKRLPELTALSICREPFHSLIRIHGAAAKDLRKYRGAVFKCSENSFVEPFSVQTFIFKSFMETAFHLECRSPARTRELSDQMQLAVIANLQRLKPSLRVIRHPYFYGAVTLLEKIYVRQCVASLE